MTALTQNNATELLTAALSEHKHWVEKVSRGTRTELFFEHPNGTEYVSLHFQKDNTSKGKNADKPITFAVLSRAAVPGHCDDMPESRKFSVRWGAVESPEAPTLEDLAAVLSNVTN